MPEVDGKKYPYTKEGKEKAKKAKMAKEDTMYKIIESLIDEDLISAKKEIENALYSKINDKLEEKYSGVAPEVFEAKKDDDVDIDEKKAKKKKLDPVGKEDEDIDNDGDADDSDEYLSKRRENIAKAMISRNKKVKKQTNEEADTGKLKPNAAPHDPMETVDDPASKTKAPEIGGTDEANEKSTKVTKKAKASVGKKVGGASY